MRQQVGSLVSLCGAAADVRGYVQILHKTNGLGIGGLAGNRDWGLENEICRVRVENGREKEAPRRSSERRRLVLDL